MEAFNDEDSSGATCDGGSNSNERLVGDIGSITPPPSESIHSKSCGFGDDYNDGSIIHDSADTALVDQLEHDEKDSFIAIEIISYGKRYGKPNSLDQNWNCTKIGNPISSSRKGRTGLDKRLRSEVMRGDIAQCYVREAVEYCIDRLRFTEDSCKDSSIRIGFGCEMGKHRSVSVAYSVAEELRRELNCAVNLVHRDIEERGGNVNGDKKSRRSKKKWKQGGD